MLEEAKANDSADGNHDAVKDENSNASNRFLDELMSGSATSSTARELDTVRIPNIDITDCFPDLRKYAPIDHFPIENQPQPKDKPIYIPSPDEMAPIMIPGFFERYPKSPELDKVGEAADKLAHLMKGNASPEEQQKAWEAYAESSKNLPPNLAALRLNLSLYQQDVPGSLSAKVNSYDGKLSLIDYGSYESMGKLDYKAPDSPDLSFNAEKNPEVEKSISEFAQQLQKGVSSEELKQLLSGLLHKLSAANLDSSSATSAIYRGLSREPNNKYDALNISREPSFMVDGKPVRVYVNARMFDKEVTLGVTPEPRKVFG